MSIIPKVGGLIDLVKKNAKSNPDILIGQNCSEFDDPELRKLCYQANSSNDNKNGTDDEKGSNVAIIATVVICIIAIALFLYFKMKKS